MGKLVVALTLAVSLDSCQRERQGTVKYVDCREVVPVKRDDVSRLWSRFTCDTQRSLSGQVMRGECVRVELADTGTCNRAFVYQQEPFRHCPPTSPWLGFDDQCHAEWTTGMIYTVRDGR